MKYIVLEIQKTGDVVTTISTVYDDRPHADASFYTILSVCALSTLDKHGAMIINENGAVVKSEVYERTVQD